MNVVKQERDFTLPNLKYSLSIAWKKNIAIAL